MGDVLQCQSQDLLLLFIIKYYFNFIKEREKYGLRFSLLFSKTVECGLCGVLSSLPLFLFSSQLILSNQVNQPSTRDADMKGIKYSHPKKDIRYDYQIWVVLRWTGGGVRRGVGLLLLLLLCCHCPTPPKFEVSLSCKLGLVLFFFFQQLASPPLPPCFFQFYYLYVLPCYEMCVGVLLLLGQLDLFGQLKSPKDFLFSFLVSYAQECLRCGFGPFLAPHFVVQFSQNHNRTTSHSCGHMCSAVYKMQFEQLKISIFFKI